MRCIRCGHKREDDNLTYDGRPWARVQLRDIGGVPIRRHGLLCPWCAIKVDKLIGLEIKDSDEQDLEYHDGQ